MSIYIKMVALCVVIFCSKDSFLLAMQAAWPAELKIPHCDEERLLQVVIMHPVVTVHQLVYSMSCQASVFWWLYAYYFAKEFITSNGNIEDLSSFGQFVSNEPAFCAAFKRWVVESRGRPLSVDDADRVRIRQGDVGKIFHANLKNSSGRDILNRRMVRFDSLTHMNTVMNKVLASKLPCVLNGEKSGAVDHEDKILERASLLRQLAKSSISKKSFRPFVILLNLGSEAVHYDVAIGVVHKIVDGRVVNKIYIFDPQNSLENGFFYLVAQQIYQFLEKIYTDRVKIAGSPVENSDDESVEREGSPAKIVYSNTDVSDVTTIESLIQELSVDKDFYTSNKAQLKKLREWDAQEQGKIGPMRLVYIPSILAKDQLAHIYVHMVNEIGVDSAANFFVEAAQEAGFSMDLCNDIIKTQEYITMGMSALDL